MNLIREKSGFTFIVIMVLASLIFIALTFTLPNILRSRNEIAAISHCRLIYNACQSYYSNSMPHAYPANLQELIEPNSNPPYINAKLASGEEQGYTFTYNLVNENRFTLRLSPKLLGKTGIRHFYVDETGIIRYRDKEEAGPNDPSIP